jgi:putative DNA primase/helicase
LNQLVDILADYAVTATMDTFTASSGDKHSTDIASLKGARVAAGSETSAGKRWDEQRIKSLTGGERVTARFMRKDNFTFVPQAKLIFIGNHQPELRDVGKAMKRRILMVPFLVTPKQIDMALGEKLRREAPAILAWMIEGCLAWQRDGLAAPAVVRAATDEYFENEDSYGKWARECVVFDRAGTVTSQELFQSYQEWAYPKKEVVGSLKRLSQALIAKGWSRWQDPKTRQMGFSGVRLNGRTVDFVM